MRILNQIIQRWKSYLSSCFKSLREDMVLEDGAACTSLDQSLAVCNITVCATINPVSHEVNVDIGVMRGDTDKEHFDKESLSLIPTSPQTPTSSDEETFNQLASKARDSLEKKKTSSPGSSKKNKKSGSSWGGSQGNHCGVVWYSSLFSYDYWMLEC